MAQNCINYYYSCRHTYKNFRITDKAFWIKYTSPLAAFLPERTSYMTLKASGQ